MFQKLLTNLEVQLYAVCNLFLTESFRSPYQTPQDLVVGQALSITVNAGLMSASFKSTAPRLPPPRLQTLLTLSNTATSCPSIRQTALDFYFFDI